VVPSLASPPVVAGQGWFPPQTRRRRRTGSRNRGSPTATANQAGYVPDQRRNDQVTELVNFLLSRIGGSSSAISSTGTSAIPLTACTVLGPSSVADHNVARATH
jgi:hypothetical protein